MLVLGRKPGEYVMIGDKIKVKLVKSLTGELRLAIEAPREMAIIRGEVWESKTVIQDKDFQLLEKD